MNEEQTTLYDTPNDVNMYRNIFLQFPKLNYRKLREKTCRQLIHIISHSRLGQKMKFDSYGDIHVDGTGQYMCVTKTGDTFSRKNTMCLIYNINKENVNTKYDKLFLFMHSVQDNEYFNYIVYNTETGESVSHFYKNPDISAFQDNALPSSVLLTDLNISFNRMEDTAKLYSVKEISYRSK